MPSDRISHCHAVSGALSSPELCSKWDLERDPGDRERSRFRQDPHAEPREVLEAGCIGGNDPAAARQSGRRYQQVMRATGPSGPPRMCEELSVGTCRLEVVRLHRETLEQRIDKASARFPASSLRKLDADQELGRRHRSDCHVILVANHFVDRSATALGRDQDGRIEDQPLQRRSCAVSRSRSSESSPAQVRSTFCLRSSSLSDRPDAAAAGEIAATARPRRSTTTVSPERSTLSSRSANWRAASVAVSLLIKSDYQITAR